MCFIETCVKTLKSSYPIFNPQAAGAKTAEKFLAGLAADGPKPNAGNRSMIAVFYQHTFYVGWPDLGHVRAFFVLLSLSSPPAASTCPTSGVKHKMMAFPTSAQHPGRTRAYYRALGTFVAPNSMLSSAEADRGGLLTKPLYLELPSCRQTTRPCSASLSDFPSVYELTACPC